VLLVNLYGIQQIVEVSVIVYDCHLKFFGHCVASIKHKSSYNKDQHDLALVYSITSAHNSSLIIYRSTHIIMIQKYKQNTNMYRKDGLVLKFILPIHL